MKWKGIMAGVLLLTLIGFFALPAAAADAPIDREAAVAFSVDDGGPLVFADAGVILMSEYGQGKTANCSRCHGAEIVESGERRPLFSSSSYDPGGWQAEEYPLFYKDIVTAGGWAGSEMRASPFLRT